jgi:mannose/fructose/N-acetylgalactosamine-specific phosphotransferase system component IIB
VFARIDERLIHGQVVTAWVGNTNCNTILVIDDATARNTMIATMYSRLAPSGTTCMVYSVEKAIAELTGEGDKGERIMLLAKTPQVFEALVNGGVPLTQINLGGMGLSRDRKPFYDNVSASLEEIECMKRLIAKGVDMTYQVAPYSKAVSVKKIIETMKA